MQTRETDVFKIDDADGEPRMVGAALEQRRRCELCGKINIRIEKATI
jgi:hypothetical protein